MDLLLVAAGLVLLFAGGESLVVSLRAPTGGRVWGVAFLAAYGAYVWAAQG